MVVQGVSEAQYNPKKEEITVFSKHSFCGREKKIVGAVTVIFLQSENILSPPEIHNNETEIESSTLQNIPTSLSVINLPHFSEMLTGTNSVSSGNNFKRDFKCVSAESFGSIMTEKFIKNLDGSPDQQADPAEISNDKNSKEENHELSSMSSFNVIDSDKNQSEVANEPKVKDCFDKDMKNTEEECDAVANDIRGSAENEKEVDMENGSHSCQKCSIQKVDIATNTETQDDVVKEFTDASTYVCIDDEMNNLNSPVTLKRKRLEDIHLKEITDYVETEDGNMFIIGEVKSSSEDSSESQDSVEVSSEASNSSSISVQSPVVKFPKLHEQILPQDSDSPLSGDLVVMRENDVMENHDSSNGANENNDFQNSSNVSVVDLSEVPVSYTNLPSRMMSDNLSEEKNVKTVHKTSANIFFNQDTSDMDTSTMSAINQMQTSQNPRPKFVRSTSLSKPLVKSTIEKCKICKRSLTSLADMFHHSKIHNIGIKCCVCGMKAFDWNVMKHHYTWHLQRTSFKCPHCSTTFCNRDSLAAHMKIHTAKKLIHAKNTKLHPPASKFIVGQNRNTQNDNIPNLSLLNKPLTNQTIAASSRNNRGSHFGRRKFTPVKKHVPSFEHLYQSNQSQSSSNTQYHESQTKEPVNINHILNYSCGCCNEKFVNVEKLKRHVLMYHSEQTMSDTCDSYFESSTTDTKFAESDSSASSSIALSYTPESSSMVEIKQEKVDPEIIDIEQLGKFTENLENSRSTTNSDQFYEGINQMYELEQEVMSSFMETTPEKSSPLGRQQRKSACRLANVIPVCRFCGVFLNTWNDILEHRFSHPEEIGQQLACTVCSSVLSTRDSLKRHAINHMGIRHQCKFCTNEYSRKDSLMNHMRSAHGYSNHS